MSPFDSVLAVAALLLVLAPLFGRVRDGARRDAIFAVLLAAAGAATGAAGIAHASVGALVASALALGGALVLAARRFRLGLPLAFLAAGLAVWGGATFRAVHRDVAAMPAAAILPDPVAVDVRLAASLAARTANERVAIFVFDGRDLAPERAARAARAADVELALDLAPPGAERPGLDVLREVSAFAVAEVPLVALAGVREDGRERGFEALSPRPYLDLVLGPDLPGSLAAGDAPLVEHGRIARGRASYRVLAAGAEPGEDAPHAAALRALATREGYSAVLHPDRSDSRAVRDDSVTWVGVGRDEAGGGRPVRLVVEPFEVRADRLDPLPPRAEEGTLREAGATAAALAERDPRAARALIAAGAGLASLLFGLLALLAGRSAPGEARVEPNPTDASTV